MGGPTGGPTYTGLLPSQDEGVERLLNTCVDYNSATREGSLRVNNALPNGSSVVKYAAISASTSGDNTIVAAVTGKKIRVLSLVLVSAGTTTTAFESAAGGTALTGDMALVANTGYVLPYNPFGWFQTVASELLNLELSAAIAVAGSLTYVEV